MNIRKNISGFTLVELIIALLILSIVMVLCGSGFRFGTRVWDVIDKQSIQMDTLQAVHGFLRKSISASLVRNQLLEDQNSSNESLFEGNAKQLHFISHSPQYGIDDFLYAYDLYLNAKEGELVLNHQPYNATIKDASRDSTATLLTGVKFFEIKYFSGYEDDESQDDWSSNWNDDYSLPLLVKINVVFEDASIQWPELVIQMRNGPYVVR